MLLFEIFLCRAIRKTRSSFKHKYFITVFFFLNPTDGHMTISCVHFLELLAAAASFLFFFFLIDSTF